MAYLNIWSVYEELVIHPESIAAAEAAAEAASAVSARSRSSSSSGSSQSRAHKARPAPNMMQEQVSDALDVLLASSDPSHRFLAAELPKLEKQKSSMSQARDSLRAYSKR